MSFRTLHRTTATLLVAMLAVLACAEPSHASVTGRPRRSEDPGPATPLRALFSLVLQLFEDAGGGMDPNGFH